MTKFVKWISILCVLGCFVFLSTVMIDRHRLNTDIIRLHIVAQSNAEKDQDIKLQVRDAVMMYLQKRMGNIENCKDAELYLKSILQELENEANAVLAECAADYSAKVTLRQEPFDIRHYETFSLPSGVYQSLRIELGAAEGQNWWCVVFPSLCTSASSDTGDVSVFSDRLTDTIEGRNGYELRFFLLDWLGSFEKFFFRYE